MSIIESKTTYLTILVFQINLLYGYIFHINITVDNGNEYNLLKDEIENKGSVLTRKNMQAINTLAVVDSVIRKLKTILSSQAPRP